MKPNDPRDYAEDAALVRRCLDGDEESWDRLIARHRGLMLSVAHRNGLYGDEAEDVFQSVCVTMLERLELLNDHRSLAAWLATTTARRCWRQRRGSRELPELDNEIADLTNQAPDLAVEEALEHDAVRVALAALDEPCHSILQYLFVEELSYREVATRLDMAESSVGVYRRRCLSRLESHLSSAGWLGPRGVDAP